MGLVGERLVGREEGYIGKGAGERERGRSRYGGSGVAEEELVLIVQGDALLLHQELEL